jgi:hypothetical protein
MPLLVMAAAKVDTPPTAMPLPIVVAEIVPELVMSPEKNVT